MERVTGALCRMVSGSFNLPPPPPCLQVVLGESAWDSFQNVVVGHPGA